MKKLTTLFLVFFLTATLLSAPASAATLSATEAEAVRLEVSTSASELFNAWKDNADPNDSRIDEVMSMLDEGIAVCEGTYPESLLSSFKTLLLQRAYSLSGDRRFYGDAVATAEFVLTIEPKPLDADGRSLYGIPVMDDVYSGNKATAQYALYRCHQILLRDEYAAYEDAYAAAKAEYLAGDTATAENTYATATGHLSSARAAGEDAARAFEAFEQLVSDPFIAQYLNSNVPEGIQTEEGRATARDELAAEVAQASADPVWPPAARLGVVTITEDSNLRSEGNADSTQVGKVKKGETYDCVHIADSGWFCIVLADGTEGYVSHKRAELVEE